MASGGRHLSLLSPLLDGSLRTSLPPTHSVNGFLTFPNMDGPNLVSPLWWTLSLFLGFRVLWGSLHLTG